jgi:hypothetical protein
MKVHMTNTAPLAPKLHLMIKSQAAILLDHIEVKTNPCNEY